MAYEMVKLTGNETEDQLNKLILGTYQSIEALESYLSDRHEYLRQLEIAKNTPKLETIDDLL